MRRPVRSSAFRRDVKRVQKRRKDSKKLREVISLLLADEPIPEHFREHPLRGNWRGYRDLHIEPDWLLIYRVVGDELHLVRTGTHADLFQT